MKELTSKEFRNIITRVRKAQDAIVSGKALDETSLHCDVCNYAYAKCIDINAYQHEGSKIKNKAYATIFAWTPREEIETQLAEISNVIGITI